MITYTLITGTYYIVGYSPDADSIKFRADNPDLWTHIETDHYKRFAGNLKDRDGIVTLRLQGIDGIETHFSPPNIRPPGELAQKVKASKLAAPKKGNHKQPEAAGQAATDILLAMLGVTKTKWRTWGRRTWVDKAVITRGTATVTVTDKYDDAIPGYIVVGDMEKNGRPLSWVFSGNAPYADGTFLDAAQLAEMVTESGNYRLVEQGMVYPYFFKNLPAKLRMQLQKAAQIAQEQADDNASQGNVWSMDHSRAGIDLPDLSVLYEKEALFPYVFRRIITHWYAHQMGQYFEAVERGLDVAPTGNDLTLNLDGFFKSGNPWVFVTSQQEFTRLHTILEIKRNSLKWHTYPYDIVFLS